MAKKRKLTPNQAEYQHQLKLLKDRIRKWEKKGLLYDKPLPEIPKKIGKKHIQQLKNIQLRKFSKEEKQQMRQRYEDVVTGKITPEEQDNLTDMPNRYVDDMNEMNLWIVNCVSEMLNPTLIKREREGARNQLQILIDDAHRMLGTENFYNMLQDSDTVTQLNNAAFEYLQSYITNKGYDTGAEALRTFVRILNLGRPLTNEQEDMLQVYGHVLFDYTETDYDQ